MQRRGNRIFKEGSAHHLYLKALKGNVLFYRTEDYIFFLTLLSVLARRYGIHIEALCIMFNHIHMFVRAADVKVFKAFCRDLQSIFSTGYNKEYHLKGKLMMRSGYAPKSSRKSILSCLIYIVNLYNPIDKDSFLKRFGNWKTAMTAIDSTTGADHDIQEKWEDYSVYLAMLKQCLRLRIRPERINTIEKEEKLKLINVFATVTHSAPEHIRRFLHL